MNNLRSVTNNFIFSRTLLGLAFIYLFASNLSAQCPDVQALDLRGVPGFAQVDDLAKCGQADTLAIIVFTDDPGSISGMEMTVNMEDGMEYAGYESTHYGGGTTISNVDPDPTSPSFLLEGVTGNEIFVAYIAVKATCDVDIEATDYKVSLDFEYVFTDTMGNIMTCDGTFDLDESYNNSFSEPVINIRSLSPAEATLGSIGDPYCQTIQISQDGLGTYLDSLDFALCGIVDGGDVMITSMSVNGMPATYTYDASDTSYHIGIDNSFFPANGTPNPTDDKFDTDETMNIEICYQIADCPSGPRDFPISYKASYGCGGDVCQITQKTSFVKIRPTGAVLPTATVEVVGSAEICGDPAVLNLTVTNPNANTNQFMMNDLSIGFNTCVKSNLGIADVMIGGTSLDPALYTWDGPDILINFVSLGMDPDPGTGLVDADGDGFYDDLPGGEMIEVTILLEMECSSDASSCTTVDCGFAQFFVEGTINCGTPFKNFPPVMGGDLVYTPTSDMTNLAALGDMVGTTPMYDFGTYGGGPTNTSGPTKKTKEVEYCYTFDAMNVTPCASTPEVYFQLVFAADPIVASDIDFEPGTAMFDDGTGYVAVADADVDVIQEDPSTKIIQINAGSPASGTQICYKVTIAVDTAVCSPRQYFSGNMKVIESCPDCEGGCDIVKACKSELFSGDPNATGCICMFEMVGPTTKDINGDVIDPDNSAIYSYQRKNLGYTDKTLTTKVDRADVSGADLNRLMPCDTIMGEERWVIKDMAFFENAAWWSWGKWSRSTGSFERGMVEAELKMDSRNMKLLEFSLIKNGNATKIPMDLTSIPSCVSDYSKPATIVNRSPITNYMGDAPMIGDELQTYKPGLSNGNGTTGAKATGSCFGYDSYDGRDNSYFGFTLYNNTDYYENCRDDQRTANIEGQGNCIQDWLDTYGISQYDTIYFKWEVPVMKNPALAAKLKIEADGLEPAGFNPVVPQNNLMIGYSTSTYAVNQFNSSCFNYNEGGCGESPVFQTACPGDVTVKSELNIDDCGGDAKHIFTFDGVLPNDWFLDEYRPLMDITDVTVPVFSPAAYCGNAKLKDINGVEIPLSVDSVIMGECTMAGGDDVCAVSSGDHMNLTFNFKDAGNSPFVVGMGLIQDSVILTYDLCMVCPEVAQVIGYEVVTNYQYVCGEPDPCRYKAYTGNTATINPTARPELFMLVNADGTPRSGNWYTELLGDTLQQKRDTSIDVVINDLRKGRTALLADNTSGTNLLASGSPGTSVEYVDMEVCAAPDPMPLPPGYISGVMNHQATIKLPNSVSLIEVLDGPMGTALPAPTLIAGPDAMGFSTYSIVLPDLAAGECTMISVGTTLLFCPEAPAPSPIICTNFTSNCSPPEVQAAIAAVSGEGEPCSGAEICYSYIFGEADLQTEWFLPASGSAVPELCDEIEFAFRVKNVKVLTLLDLLVMVDIPNGLDVIPGSWEFSYPGNTTLNWVGILPPDLVSGNHYEYTDDMLFSTDINANGFPGITSGLDSNFIAFKFKATTRCDDFLSGSIMHTETQAADPCGPDALSTGDVQSPPIILQGADPADFAQLLVVAEPDVTYCGATATQFNLSALNISENPTADSVTICLTIPPELTYQSGSAAFAVPTYTPTEIITMVGSDVQVCFDAPKLEVGEKYSFSFIAEQMETVDCGPIMIGADIKSFVPGITCTSTGMMCGVNVQNSVNPTLNVDLGPPLQTLDVRLTRECSATDDPVTLCYEVDLTNPTPVAYNGTTRVGIHQDVTDNGILDDFDPELAGMDHVLALAAGDTITLMMCLDVPAGQACPVIVAQTYETTCACDMAENAFDKIPPSFLAELGDDYVLCPGQPLELEVCAGYEFALDPAEGGVLTQTGDMLSVALNPGFGEDDPVKLTATNTIGTCTEDFSINLNSLGDFEFGPFTAEVCEGECTGLDIALPNNIADAVTIMWAPAAGLDDTTIEDPEVCGMTAGVDQVYTVTLVFNDMCMIDATYTVTVLPIGTVNIDGPANVCLHPTLGGTLTADMGFDSYVWYKVLPGGIELVVSSGASNEYTATEEGDYYVKANSSANPCPAISSAVTVSPDFCVDLALTKIIISPAGSPAVGDIVTYEIAIHNQGGVTIDDITITDFVPAGLKNVDGAWSPLNATNANVTHTIMGNDLEAGETVIVEMQCEVLPGANATNTVNIAEITMVIDDDNNDVTMDDVDSTPDSNVNDDAGGNPNTATDAMTSDFTDPVIQGDGTGSPGDIDPATDEDDNDPAAFPIFDLALTKMVDPASLPPSGMYTVGDEITFLVTVVNQGTVDATNIEVKDLIPCGMMVFDETDPVNVASGWSANTVDANASSGYSTTTTVAALAAGALVQIPIKMILGVPSGGATNMGMTITYSNCVAASDPYLNYSYIESAQDGDMMPATDIDSQPGTFTPEEEGTVPNMNGDNDLISNGNMDPGSQDDSDPANVEIFDLALSKILNPDEGPYKYGDIATFEICVTNQGNVPTDSVVIIDYIPAGYTFSAGNDPKWTDNGDGTATYNTDDTDFPPSGQILFLEQVCTTIDLVVQSAGGDPDGYINAAEIMGATTVVDPDRGGPMLPVSTFVTADNDGAFDADPDNDAGGALDTGSDALTSDPTDPAIQGNGTGMPGDTDPATDTDDADIAAIDIVDFALKKVVASPMAPYSYGDTITYDITVYNQGTVVGNNITVTDYAPTGLTFFSSLTENPGWGGTNAAHDYMINGPIEPGDSVVISIDLIVNATGSTMQDYVNIAEIETVFSGPDNVTNDDVDSTPGGTPIDDAGGAVDTPSDNAVDGDGSGAPGDEDPLTDEDDNDPAFVQIFDLAQTKEIIGGPYGIGDLVPYKITTYNQGNVPVTNVIVNDYIPSGLVLSVADNPDWAITGTNSLGVTASTTILDTIQPNASVMDTLYLTVQVGDGSADAYTNISEISSFEDTNGNSSDTDPTIADSDSTPDDDPTNDAGGNPDTDTDGSIDGDGSGDPLDEDANTDEDDSDPAILAIADLALIKTTTEMGPFAYGDIVTFDISVMNQGNVVATDVEVTDYIPAGFEYEISNNGNGWIYDGTNATNTLAGPFAPGDSMVVSIDLKIINASDNPTDAYTNEAEISEAFEADGTTPFDDVDSDADSDNTNDNGGNPTTDSDNSTGGTGINGAGMPDDNNEDTDEDDADPELIRIVDVAQTKKLVSTPPFMYGDSLEFVITTYNQGNVPLTNVEVTDYVPAGFVPTITSCDPSIGGWDCTGANPTTVITETILPGDSVETSIFMYLIMTDGADDAYTNVSEVSMMQDTTNTDVSDQDADSDINDDPTDNGGGSPDSESDDSIDGDGTGNPGDEDAATDEDNSDPALVEIFDLAIIMENSTDVITMYGQDVTFPITLANQGNVDSEMPVVTVSVPDGFSFDINDNTGWVDNGDGTVSYTYPDTLEPGDVEMFDLVLTSQPATGAGAWTPIAEITEDNPAVDGLEDIDSNPDTDFTNDAGGNALPDTGDNPDGIVGSDDSLDGDGTGGAQDTDAATDEDDNDPEFVRLVDMAMTKMIIGTGPYMYGDTIPFVINTRNQGNVAMQNVEISDYIPEGFMFRDDINPDWTGTQGPGPSTATLTRPDTILGGTIVMDTINLILLQTSGSTDGYTNVSEISYMQDLDGNDTNGDGPDGGITDIDSDINNDPSDNGGGAPGTDSDDTMGGDGTGNPDDEDAATDEDNSDPALLEVFDLAIIMENSTDVITMYGQDITFPITLANQGNVDSEMPVVTVSVPDGFSFDINDNTGWVDNGDGTVSYTYPVTLEPGDVEMFDLVLTSQPATGAGAWTPIAEITEDNSAVDGLEDIDSNPDAIFTNDAGGNSMPDTGDDVNGAIGSDDSLDGDGTGGEQDTDAATDEDDNDPEFVRIVDMAQTKMIVGNGPFIYGDTIPFVINSRNQGNVAMTNVEISDYIPAGFMFRGDINPGWTGTNGPGPSTATLTRMDTILGGTLVMDTINLILVMTDGGGDNYTNVSEISEMQDTIGNSTDGTGPSGGITDVDSDINNDPSDNGGGAPGTDSDDTMGGDGTGMPGDTLAMTDDDNSDPALVRIVDLALTKTTNETGPFMYGQSVLFTVNVRNQGNVDANNVLVTDYIPVGFSYDPVNDANGWSLNGANAEYTIMDTLAAGEIQMIDIALIIEQTTGGDDNYTNVAEISSFEDIEGMPIGDEDIDSTPDAINGNDPGGEPDSDSDDTMAGDGTNGGGAPGDTDEASDEDDSDPELIEIFDLALQKHIMMTQGYSFGDTAMFMIDVTNQGNVTALNVEVTDYIPSGYQFVPGTNWTDNGDMTATYSSIASLAPGDTVQLEASLIVVMTEMFDNHTNFAEISSAEDEDGNNTDDMSLVDVDSTPDALNDGNDAGGEPGTSTDNIWDNQEGDEDDHDPAIIRIVDVALVKSIAPDQTPYAYGDTITFEIDVINQGNVDLVDVEVSDYIAAGYTYAVANDTDNGIGGIWALTGTTAKTTIPGPIARFDTVTVTIDLVLNQLIPSDQPGAWTNYAEVSMMWDTLGGNVSTEDIDSQSDDTNDDPGGQPGTADDDFTSGDGSMGEDEDDHDPAMPLIFDLALTKQLVYPDSIYKFGDIMEFYITLHNQGNVPSTDIEVTEYVPAALTEVGATNDPLWMFGGSTATYVYPEVLEAGTSDTILLNMVFQMGSAAEDYVNYAEISEAADTLGNNTTDNPDVVYDVDSTTDDINGNDAGGDPDSDSDNVIDGDATGEIGDDVAATDEDDHDPVQLGFVDMALVKTLVTTGPVQVGQDVTFEIEVINQGTFTMVDIDVVDYIPDGFVLSVNDENDWEDNGDGTASVLVEGPLAFGESETIEIVLTVQPNANAGNMVNVAELTEFFFDFGDEATELDIDSDADNMPDNDGGGAIYTDSDDAVDGDGTGDVGGDDPTTDEDDADPAAPQVLDLALRKTTDHTTAVRPGDVVTFMIEVCNQGNIPVKDVVIEDYIPAGMKLSAGDANGWTVDPADSTVLSNTITDVIERDSCVIVEVDMEILENFSVTDMVNVSEITEIYDTTGTDLSGFDIDSTPGDDDGEAEGTIYTGDDDSLDGSVPNGGDSDDADPAAPPVFDLAIRKTNTVVGPSSIGDIVPFEITIFNQGNLAATDIEVIDYIPAGLALATVPENDDWTLIGSDAHLFIGDTLAAFSDTTVTIHLEVLPTATPMTVVNMTEIFAAEDTFGIDYTVDGNDLDSDFDADNGNDKGNDLYSAEDDKIDEFGISGGDEDDHDQAWVLLCDGMSCNGNINLSLDELCVGVVTPTMLLTGDLFPDHIYDIVIKDSYGNAVPNMFGKEHVGETFEVSIYNPLCGGNTCWMNMTVEYKFPPKLKCLDTLILSCVQASIDGVGEPDVSSNCAETELIKILEVPLQIVCDSLYTGGVKRSWIAKDEFGNFSDTCSQVVLFERTDLSSIKYPANRWINDDNAVSCSHNYETTIDGYPIPEAIGVPQLEVEPGVFIDMYPFTAATICNGYVSFSDKKLGGSTKCVTKVLRTWIVGEWHCTNPEPITYKQYIEIVDFDGPTFVSVGDQTISTESFSCTASISMPLPTISDACNAEGIRIDLGNPAGLIENYNGELITLGVGVNDIIYNVYDGCNNVTVDTVQVTVVDHADPIAVCDGHTTASLTSAGVAYVSALAIDDGSFDECGDVTLKIARMDHPLFPAAGAFFDEIQVDCSDFGTDLMVGLLVTDKGGNTNMCMVSVDVQDKIEARIKCPDNMTVECNFPFDPDHLASFFGEVEIFDNCPETNTLVDVMLGELNQCGAGTLTRQVTLFDATGTQVDICYQTILFVKGESLKHSDIIWPAGHVDFVGCIEDVTNTQELGEPTIPDTECQLVGMRYEDEFFPFNTGGTCMKVLRTWYVIDWCLPHEVPGGTLNPFSFEQTIKVINTVAPTFVTTPVDTMLCSYAADCGPVDVSGLIATATDDCSTDEELVKSYEVKDADGVIVAHGAGLNANGTYAIGIYDIQFFVEDRCGNIAVTSSVFEVRNCKLPTPYCINGLSTALVPMDLDDNGTPDAEMVMLTPDFFDGGSYHPCGYAVQLSFSADVNDTLLVFDCDNIGNNEVQLWVTDINGNQDFCRTFIQVDDNNNVSICDPTSMRVAIQGKVYTEADREILEVTVELDGADVPDETTETDGEYIFNDMPLGGSYTVNPSKDDDHRNGVNTLDLVLIQRHILDLQPITSPYKLIAADINNDEKIKPSDLLALRKLILGVTQDFPNNTSWRFVDEAYEFVDATDPLSENFDEVYDIANLQSNMWIDFIGLKVGDINGDVEANLTAEKSSESRSGKAVEISMRDIELTRASTYKVDVYSKTSGMIYGLQYVTDMGDIEVIDVLPGKLDMNLASTAQIAGEHRVAHAEAHGVKVEAGDVLYTLVLRSDASVLLSDEMSITEAYLPAEMYLGADLQAMDIVLTWDENLEQVATTEVLGALAASQNTPNPWKSATKIAVEIPVSGDVTINVTDTQGRLIYTNTSYYEAGSHSIELTEGNVPAKGVLLYEVIEGDQVVNGKMIRIE